jgi:type III secretory pathway component EscT
VANSALKLPFQGLLAQLTHIVSEMISGFMIGCSAASVLWVAYSLAVRGRVVYSVDIMRPVPGGPWWS